jgi:very-short-patch-repair endonuclease
MSEDNFTKESLAKSTSIVGELLPIIENQDGKVLEGNHRLELNPKWHRKTVKTKDRVEEILVRLHAHHRRRIPKEETQALLKELAQELLGKGVKKEDVSIEVCKIVPFDDGYVRELLPEEFKRPEKVAAAKVSAQLTAQTAKTQEIPKVECQRCHTYTSEPKQWKNGLKTHTLCESCNKRATLDPLNFHRYFELLEKKLPESLTKKPSEFKPSKLDSYEHKLGTMKVQHSKMEETILQLLLEKGVTPVQTDRSYCLVSTIPDFVFPQQNVAVYLDGKEVHEKREDKDEKLRELLSKRHGMKVVSIPYESQSKAQIEKILQTITEAVGI